VEASLSGNTDIVDTVMACDLLVIDELGKEYKKVNQHGEFDKTTNMATYCKFIAENLIKTRSDSGLATIVITNDTKEEINAKYGGVDSSLSSKLYSSSTIVLCHTGIDFRSL
jgi:DNA replication protein DnaC